MNATMRMSRWRRCMVLSSSFAHRSDGLPRPHVLVPAVSLFGLQMQHRSKEAWKRAAARMENSRQPLWC